MSPGRWVPGTFAAGPLAQCGQVETITTLALSGTFG